MSRTKGSVNHNIGGLFTFALVGVFAILSMLLAVIGINGYQKVIDVSEINSDTRASMSYIANKVRSGDERDKIRIDEHEGIKMLVIAQDVEDASYETRIYLYEGALVESLYSTYDDDFYPEDGERLIDLDDFDVRWAGDGLIFLRMVTKDGIAHELNVAIRSAL